MNRSTCSQCHTGNGFVEAYNDIPGATTGRYEDPVGITVRPATIRTTIPMCTSCVVLR